MVARRTPEVPPVAPQAAATEGLYERHAGKIHSYCLHQLGSREEAEDAVQTTFMNAFRALGRGVVPEAESAWLFKIAENVCLSRRRSSWRRGRIESPSDFDVIEEVVPGPSRQRDELIGIEDALASMPEQQRRAILLREWQGLSYREISEELELSQSAVETLIFRARRSLAQGLEQPDLIKKPKRKGFRRALHMIDLGTLAAAAKTLLTGSVAVKATAAAVAVTAAATAASVTPKLEGHSPKPAQAPAQVAPSARAPAAPAAASYAVSRRGSTRTQPRHRSRRPARPPPAKPAIDAAARRDLPRGDASAGSDGSLRPPRRRRPPQRRRAAAPAAAAAAPASRAAGRPADHGSRAGRAARPRGAAARRAASSTRARRSRARARRRPPSRHRRRPPPRSSPSSPSDREAGAACRRPTPSSTPVAVVSAPVAPTPAASRPPIVVRRPHATTAARAGQARK